MNTQPTNSPARALRQLAATLLSGLLLAGASEPALAHGVMASCTMLNRATGGTTVRVGETVELGFRIFNVCSEGHSVTIPSLKVHIHHPRGTVTFTNLLTTPTNLVPGGVASVHTNFVVQPGDEGWLAVEWEVAWVDAVSLKGTNHVVSHLQVLPGLSLKIQRAGPSSIRISWPATAMCRLVSIPVVDGQSWTPVPTVPALEGSECVVIIDASEARAEFFKLEPADVPPR